MSTRLSAGHDLLATLGNDLRDLSGLHTLVYELIQNADDALAATEMTFRITDKALIVMNDGVFSDCGDPSATECPGVPLDGERCDFHSFLRISGQAKRKKVGTTGAFGIGFTSVFQITDYPELLSRGRHWILRYDEPQAENVVVCEGCRREHAESETVFVLPWARDPRSAIRRGLGVGIPPADIAAQFVDVARACIPGAMVFLRRLERIDVLRNGRLRLESVRSKADEWTFIEHDATNDTFYTMDGGFEGAADDLRAGYPGLLGVDTREPTVSIAIPTDGTELQLPLHAVLPTQQTAPLGFRLSASFYPFQDRKRLKFESESDGESEWNRAAVRAAADLFGESAETLVRDLGPERAWWLFRASYDVAAGVNDAPDECFDAFWDALVPSLSDQPVVWTAAEDWAVASEAVLLAPAWQPAAGVLHELGLAAVHPSIAADVEAVAEDLNLGGLNLALLADALRDNDLTEAQKASTLPVRLADPAGLDSLLRVIADLVAEETVSSEPLDALNGCAVIPCHGGIVAPPNQISAEDDPSTRKLFEGLPDIHFVDLERLDEVGSSLRRMLWPLQVYEVISALDEAKESGQLDQLVTGGNVRQILRWIAEKAGDLTEDNRGTLLKLPIFPTRQGLRPLEKLQLPGPFAKDPLGVAETLDLTELEDLRSFFSDELHVPTLSLRTYVLELLGPAMREGRHFDAAGLDKLLDVLNRNLEELEEDDEVLAELSTLPLVPTSSGRRAGENSYFDGELVRQLLGGDVVVALEGSRLRRLKPLLEALKVVAEPRPADIVSAIEKAVSRPRTPDRVRRVRRVIEHLGPSFKWGGRQERERALARLEADYAELLELQWIPVAGTDEWAVPSDTYRTEFRTAFESTGRFVDVPEKTVQQPNADLLDLLGVQMRPSPDLVVEHILNCVRDGKEVRRRAYDVLDDASEEDVADLVDEPCILVERAPHVRYVAPTQVALDPWPLRGYLHALPEELAALHNLVEHLGIADRPGPDQAIGALREIGEHASDTPLAEGERAVVEACWSILEDALTEAEFASEDQEDGDLTVDERIVTTLPSLPTWPDRSGVLRRPAQLYVDDRPSLRRFMPDSCIAVLVDRPAFGLNALAAAGLRQLSDALDEDIVRVPGGEESHHLAALIRDRLEALARIASIETGSADSAEELLSLEFVHVDEIVLHRRLSGDVAVDLGEQPVAAHLDQSNARLFVVRRDPPPWTELAVEIAPLLCGDGHSPSVGSTIAGVLSARSLSDAHEALDTLQIPRVSTSAVVDLTEGVAGPLFDDEEELVDTATREIEDDTGDTTGEDEVDPDTREDEHDGSDAKTPALPGSSLGFAGTGNGQQAPLLPHSTSGAATTPSGSEFSGFRGGAGARGASKGSGSGGKRGAGDGAVSETPWRVWVSGQRGAKQEERSESEATAGLRSEVASKGVERVLHYEKEHGRSAEEMPPNNPGFDVESRSGPGRPVTRRIEVKSLAGSWQAEWGSAGNPPQLTSEQFRMSIADGTHWLYVVEHALDDDAWAIYPIQAVGQRANRYLLDHGWREAADHPGGPGAEPEEVYEPPAQDLPLLDDVIFGLEERDDGDIPFLGWDELHLLGNPHLGDICESWFTSPEAADDTDFAVQQNEQAMGPTLPFGSVAVFRPVDGSFPDGAVVLAQVGPNGDPRHAIRRAHVVRDNAGNVEGLHLVVDIPGRGDDFEFHDADAVGRVRAVYVTRQEL
jgi:hypothetical protein